MTTAGLYYNATGSFSLNRIFTCMPTQLSSGQEDLLGDFDIKSALLPASKGQRFANLLIDTILIGTFAFILLIVCALLFAEAYDDIVSDGGSSLGLLNVVYLLAHVTYYTVFEGAFNGLSMGKVITRTYAVKRNGEQVSWMNAFARSVVRLLPFEAFSAFDEPWHDKWTSTIVVKK